MITRGVIFCTVLSVAAHIGGVAVMTEPEQIEIAGAAPAPARLGNSFQDIAAGSAATTPPPDAQEPVSATAIAPDRQITAATAVEASVLPVASPVSAEPALTPQTPTLPRAPVAPTDKIAGTEPVIVAAATAQTVRPRPRPEPQVARPSSAQPAAQPAEQPPERPAEKAAEQPRASSPGPVETEQRGVAEGAAPGASDAAAAGAKDAAEAGNAAASNYPGKVMRKINRTRKPSVGVRGTAIVGFKITADGGLGSVQILRSSGESRVDQAALDHLRRAAPFPAPPPGAERRFQVEYVSRG